MKLIHKFLHHCIATFILHREWLLIIPTHWNHNCMLCYVAIKNNIKNHTHTFINHCLRIFYQVIEVVRFYLNRNSYIVETVRIKKFFNVSGSSRAIHMRKELQQFSLWSPNTLCWFTYIQIIKRLDSLHLMEPIKLQRYMLHITAL